MVLTNQNEPLTVTGADSSRAGRMYKFSGGNWTELDIELNTMREDAFAAMVPVSLLPNCRKIK